VFAGISGGILNISIPAKKNCASGHWNGKNRNNFCSSLNDFVKYVKKSRTFVLEFKIECYNNKFMDNNLKETITKYSSALPQGADETSFIDYVSSFYREHNHLPMFWILEQFFLTDPSREVKILIDTVPIFQNRKMRSMDYIGDKYEMSRERARQIHEKMLRRAHKNVFNIFSTPMPADKNDWTYVLSYIKNVLCDVNAETINECLEKEQSNFNIDFVIEIFRELFSDEFEKRFGGILFINWERHKIRNEPRWEWKWSYNHSFLIRKEYEVYLDLFCGLYYDIVKLARTNECEYDLNIKEFVINTLKSANFFLNNCKVLCYKTLQFHYFHLSLYSKTK
jgi:hypothetical protein